MPHFSNHSEENYLKTLYKLEDRQVKKINNIALSKALDLNPATVLEMIRKLAAKKLVEVSTDKSIQLTDKGKKRALATVRKHRIWEVFLVDKLNYKWNEVHDLAEQLEHIESDDLIKRLEMFLGNPAVDPHGDPIPDAEGKVKRMKTNPLPETPINKKVTVVGIHDSSDVFLKYLDKLDIAIGDQVQVVEKEEYDKSLIIRHKKIQIKLTYEAAKNILVAA